MSCATLQRYLFGLYVLFPVVGLRLGFGMNCTISQCFWGNGFQGLACATGIDRPRIWEYDFGTQNSVSSPPETSTKTQC